MPPLLRIDGVRARRRIDPWPGGTPGKGRRGSPRSRSVFQFTTRRLRRGAIPSLRHRRGPGPVDRSFSQRAQRSRPARRRCGAVDAVGIAGRGRLLPREAQSRSVPVAGTPGMPLTVSWSGRPIRWPAVARAPRRTRGATARSGRLTGLPLEDDSGQRRDPCRPSPASPRRAGAAGGDLPTQPRAAVVHSDRPPATPGSMTHPQEALVAWKACSWWFPTVPGLRAAM